MSLHSKIKAAKTALVLPTITHPFAPAFLNMSYVGRKLLDNLGKNPHDKIEIERQFAIILIGTLIAAIAFYGDKQQKCSAQPTKRFSGLPFYPISWTELYASCEIASLVGNSIEQDFDVKNPFYAEMILKIGAKIIAGGLPINLAILINTYPAMVKHLKIIGNWINTDISQVKKSPSRYFFPTEKQMEVVTQINYYQNIKMKFKKAIAACNKQPIDSKFKLKLIEEIEALKTNTLASYFMEDPTFTYENCMHLAESTLTLTKKVGANVVTEQDSQDFYQATLRFNKSIWFEQAISAILNILVGIVSGLTIGFAVGGMVGAAIGAGIGFFAGGMSAGYLNMKYQYYHNPHQPIIKTVDEIINHPRISY
jgi:hypothetical protein